MKSQEITTKSVIVPNGELAIASYLAFPEASGSFPAIIVIQEIFGVNHHIRDITRRFAQQGYVAIAPAIYQRQAPGFEAGYSEDDIKIGRVYKNQTKATELLNDIQATVDFLNGLPQVDQSGIGCIGFCFGGHVAYLAATLSEIKATASFYGAGIVNWSPGGGEPTLTRSKEIKGTLYAFFGLQDRSIPPTEVDSIEAELQNYGIAHRIFRYPQATHGFFCDQRSSYDRQAAEDAWNHVLELFCTALN